MSVILHPAQKKALFLLLFLIPFLMGLGVDSYVPSMPAIQTYFHASSHATQLTIGFYMLGYALGQLLLGILSDSLGRRKIILFWGAVYVVANIAAAFSPSVAWVMFYRFLQGFAIAGPAVAVRAIPADCFSGLELTKAMGFLATSWALGPILGPFIGSYIEFYFHWQANFYFLAGYAVLTFIYAAIVLKETHLDRSPLHFPKILGALKEALTHPVFLIYATIASLIYSILVIFNVVAPFLIQVDLGYSAVVYGRVALVLGLSYFLGNFSMRTFVGRVGSPRLILIGVVGSFVLALILLGVSMLFPMSLWSIMVPTLVMFYLCGVAFPNLIGTLAGLFPKTAGTSSAIYGSFVCAGVFLLSSLSALLPSHSQVPLAVVYLVLVSICMCLLVLKRIKLR